MPLFWMIIAGWAKLVAIAGWLVMVVFGISGLFERSCFTDFAFILPLKSSRLATDNDETAVEAALSTLG